MSIDLDDPIALMLIAAAALERSRAECAAYGGLALGMYGEPRETRDADFAVTGVDIERARLAIADLGVDVVIAFSNVRFGGCDVSRLSLVGGGKINTVGLVTPRSSRYAGNVFRRAVTGSLRGHEIRATSPEDFVILKVLATRDRDLQDARSVIETQRSRLDEALIHMEIKQLIAEIPDHDIHRRFASLSQSGSR
ncbi:MAG TPA: nucleotidyltransferase [Thermoanaerobaculia bacterium]|nr:nucleotidyltransferase [Thermoanaerobaculia bacterium]